MDNLRFRQVHLDFHTSEQMTNVGRDFDAEEFARQMRNASVDSVTCFAKCHHGMLYYNTRSEARHPHLSRNLLDEQIEALHRHGINAPIYLSAGLDEFVAARHPEWIQIDPAGARIGAGPLDAGWRNLCFNSPYVDYLIELTKEILDHFGAEVDGLFFDIVRQRECLCRRCMKDMVREGLNPESPDDRELFATRVVDAFKRRMFSVIRGKSRDCGIFHNSGHIGPYIRTAADTYTHLEVESLPSGGWGYEHFPVTARYARNLGIEFLGMTGRFLKSWADFGGFKNSAALEYECFSSLSLGGGCSVGDQLHPAGQVVSATSDLIGSVYRQVAEKEPWCRNAVTVTEIGVVTPELVMPGAAASGMNDISAGVHRMLKERHYQYDFMDFQMDFSRYKVVILPDVIRLDETQASILDEYVSRGGKLLVSYESGMAENGYEFLIRNMPASVKGDAPLSPDYLVAETLIEDGIPSTEHVMYERGLELKPTDSAKTLAQVWKPYFERNYKHFCSHFHTPVEESAGYPGIAANESIVYIGYPIFGMYKRHGARVYRDMTLNALKILLPDEKKLVLTNAPTTADITLNYQEKEDRYVLHLLHYIPERRYSATDTIEDIIPLRDVSIKLLLPKRYCRAITVPQCSSLAVYESSNHLCFTIPSVNGHQMVAIA